MIPERRFVEAINSQAHQYEMGDFPTEWEGKSCIFLLYFKIVLLLNVDSVFLMEILTVGIGHLLSFILSHAGFCLTA